MAPFTTYITLSKKQTKDKLQRENLLQIILFEVYVRGIPHVFPWNYPVHANKNLLSVKSELSKLHSNVNLNTITTNFTCTCKLVPNIEKGISASSFVIS